MKSWNEFWEGKDGARREESAIEGERERERERETVSK